MKRYTMILLMTSFFIIQSYGQNKCNCEGLIDWKFTGKILVFDKPNGKIVGAIANDSINEDYLTLTISDVKNDYFKVSLRFSISGTSKSGWIKKKKYIGTYARNYSDDINLKLYSQPDKESKVESIITTWIPELYVITDCQDSWVKVKMTYKGRAYKGWLEREMQCANPYSNCN